MRPVHTLRRILPTRTKHLVAVCYLSRETRTPRRPGELFAYRDQAFLAYCCPFASRRERLEQGRTTAVEQGSKPSISALRNTIMQYETDPKCVSISPRWCLDLLGFALRLCTRCRAVNTRSGLTGHEPLLRNRVVPFALCQFHW